MGYELAAFIAVVVAATLVAWAVAVGEPRLPVAVTRRRRPTASRTVHVAAMCLAAVAIVGGGVFGVLRWWSQVPLERGAQLLADGNAKEALQVLVNVVAERPNDARAHFYLGKAYARLGVSPAALTHLKAAVRLAPGEAEFHRHLGASYRQEGNAALARTEFETATTLEPGEPAHRVALAGSLIDEGNLEGAIAQLRRAAGARPPAPAIRLLLAMTLKLAGDPERTRHELREVMRLAPDGALGEIARQEARAHRGHD